MQLNVTRCGCSTLEAAIGSLLVRGNGGNSVPYRPLISVAPSERHRSLTVVPSIWIEGTTVRLRGGPRDGLVGAPSWVRMDRRGAGDG